MQAYRGVDGVVISLTHDECEDVVAVAAELDDLGYGERISEGNTGLDTFSAMLRSILELKEVS